MASSYTMSDADRRIARESVSNRSGGICEYCGKYVGRRGSLDHYIPSALGGSNSLTNLRWACIKCNGLKANCSPEQWEMIRPPFVQRRTKSQIKIAFLSAAIQRERQRNISASTQRTT